MLTQIYDNDPHQSVAKTNTLVTDEPGSADLESTIQFTTTTGSAYFDFSAFVALNEDGSNLETEKAKILEEDAAFATLYNEVAAAYFNFHQNACKALDHLGAVPVPVG